MSDFQHAYEKLQKEIDEMRGMLRVIDFLNDLARKNLDDLSPASKDQTVEGRSEPGHFKGAA